MSEVVVLKKERKVRQWGPSKRAGGIYLGSEELKKAGLEIGDEVDITVTADGRIVISKKGVKPNVFLKFLSQFKLGEATKVGDSFIIPIVVEDDKVEERDYITFKEAEEVRFSDTGRIDRVAVSNLSGSKVFIPHGIVMTGGTQSRASLVSAILGSGEGCEIPVKCVHASHPIRPGSTVRPIGVVPRTVSATLMQPSSQVSQHTTWASVSLAARALTDWRERISSTFERYKDVLEDYTGPKDNLASMVMYMAPVAADLVEAKKKWAEAVRRTGWRRK